MDKKLGQGLDPGCVKPRNQFRRGLCLDLVGGQPFMALVLLAAGRVRRLAVSNLPRFIKKRARGAALTMLGGGFAVKPAGVLMALPGRAFGCFPGGLCLDLRSSQTARLEAAGRAAIARSINRGLEGSRAGAGAPLRADVAVRAAKGAARMRDQGDGPAFERIRNFAIARGAPMRPI